MKVIDIHSFDTILPQAKALFFTDEGIMMECVTHSPLIAFSTAIHDVGLSIHHVYMIDDQLVVRCHSSVSSVSPPALPPSYVIYPPKVLLKHIDTPIQLVVLRAIHWITWNETQQYCSQCGQSLQRINTLPEKHCIACKSIFYPSLAPAVMVVIQRENELLLARSPHFNPGVYSAIAGFVELGEIAESTAHREVKEEVGIEISDLTYFGTQSWPFPNSFIIAFKARYLSGTLTIDHHEIEDAQWFNVHALPPLPALSSISRQLIDSCVYSI